MAAQVVGGRSPAEEKKARRQGRDGDPTMREFGDRYYREQAMRNRKNPPEFLRYLTTYVYPAIGQKRLKELTAVIVPLRGCRVGSRWTIVSHAFTYRQRRPPSFSPICAVQGGTMPFCRA